MEIFLSWAGERSRAVAGALRQWLPEVIQKLKPWMSSEDLAKGSRWSASIAERLGRAGFGIICVTSDNQERPWLLFEAGALAKAVTDARVCPYLLDIRPTDLRDALAQFNAAEASEPDSFRLLSSINEALGADALDKLRLEKAFKRYWPDLERQLAQAKALNSGVAKRVPRATDELLDEILTHVRALSRQAAADPTLQKFAGVMASLTPLERKVLQLRLGFDEHPTAEDVQRVYEHMSGVATNRHAARDNPRLSLTPAKKRIRRARK